MRRFVLVGSFVAIGLACNPARAQFCPGASGWVFDDVLASDPFCAYITWMAQNGVSVGCQVIDVDHRLYCPNSDVSRTQMAAFMNRLTTQPDSTSPDVGTITKPGGVFLHNFGTNNTFLGVRAGNFTLTGGANTAVGHGALSNNASGNANVAIGRDALGSNTDGLQNIAIGDNALAKSTTSIGNTAIGNFAMANSIGGSNNVGIGLLALWANQTGFSNVAIGTNPLAKNTTGSYQIAVGASALESNTTGSTNVAVGPFALNKNSTGSSNVAVGHDALTNATGSENIALGEQAGSAVTTGSFNIHIGHKGLASDVQTIRLGAESHSRTFIAGIRGVTTTNNDAVNVVIDGNGQLGTISSSRDAKDDIADMGDASASLLRLRPVTFHYRADRNSDAPRLQYGLIAEEVADVYPGIVAKDKEGRPVTVMYQYLAPMLLNELKRQQRTIEGQARELAEQSAQIVELKMTHSAEILELKRAVMALKAGLDARPERRASSYP